MPTPVPNRMPTDSGPCRAMVSRSFAPRSSRHASQVVFCKLPSTSTRIPQTDVQTRQKLRTVGMYGEATLGDRSAGEELADRGGGLLGLVQHDQHVGVLDL